MRGFTTHLPEQSHHDTSRRHQEEGINKLANNDSVQPLLTDASGEAKYKHQSGEVSTVGIAVAGLGTKRVRVANLPSEVPDTALTTSLAPFGKVVTIQQEMWTKVYRYQFTNGIRQVNIMLTNTSRPI